MEDLVDFGHQEVTKDGLSSQTKELLIAYVNKVMNGFGFGHKTARR